MIDKSKSGVLTLQSIQDTVNMIQAGRGKPDILLMPASYLKQYKSALGPTYSVTKLKEQMFERNLNESE